MLNALLLLASAAVLAAPARALSSEEHKWLSGFHALLELSPDPCRVAPRLEAQYKLILSSATPEQNVADIRALVDGKAGIPLRLADGMRVAGVSAMYDPGTNVVYLSSPEVSGLSAPGGGCLTDAQLGVLAHDTVGVYVHELTHALQRKALGADFVDTTEGEIHAYARESRFLAGLEGWPSKTVSDELRRRSELDGLIQENEEILDRVKALRGEEPNDENLKKLQKHVETLDALHAKIDELKKASVDVDSLQLGMTQMVEKWKEGWPQFLDFMLDQDPSKRPSLTRREENAGIARRFLARSRAALEKEKPGTLDYDVVKRSVSLAEQDVRFWGDEKQVEKAIAYYRTTAEDVRPPSKPAADQGGK